MFNRKEMRDVGRKKMRDVRGGMRERVGSNILKRNCMKGYHEYRSCIEACLRCAAVCNHCASSCTQERDVAMMARCIQLDMECAAICSAAAQLMSLGSVHAPEICGLCASACEAC